MHIVTATDASRSFAALLDEVEAGATVVITRGGRRVASIGPAPTGNVGALRELLDRQVDDEFAEDVARARGLAEASEPAWPAD